MSSVLSKNGKRCETVRCRVSNPRMAIISLNGPSKLRVVDRMVTLRSDMRAAKVPEPAPMSRPIRMLPFLSASTCKTATSFQASI